MTDKLNSRGCDVAWTRDQILRVCEKLNSTDSVFNRRLAGALEHADSDNLRATIIMFEEIIAPLIEDRLYPNTWSHSTIIEALRSLHKSGGNFSRHIAGAILASPYKIDTAKIVVLFGELIKPHYPH